MSIDNISSEELALLSVLVGIGISCNLDDEDQNIVGNFISSVGQIILTISASLEASEKNNKNNESRNCKLNKRVKDLERQLSIIQKKLNKLN